MGYDNVFVSAAESCLHSLRVEVRILNGSTTLIHLGKYMYRETVPNVTYFTYIKETGCASFKSKIMHSL